MLRVLTAPEAERAAAIGALYVATDGGEAADYGSTSKTTGRWRYRRGRAEGLALRAAQCLTTIRRASPLWFPTWPP